MLSINELAARLSVSPCTIRRLAKKSRIPFSRVGRQYRFDLDKVRAALESV